MILTIREKNVCSDIFVMSYGFCPMSNLAFNRLPSSCQHCPAYYIKCHVLAKGSYSTLLSLSQTKLLFVSFVKESYIHCGFLLQIGLCAGTKRKAVFEIETRRFGTSSSAVRNSSSADFFFQKIGVWTQNSNIGPLSLSKASIN